MWSIPDMPRWLWAAPITRFADTREFAQFASFAAYFLLHREDVQGLNAEG